MDLRKCILTKNKCYKIGGKLTPVGVMWHSTGANNPNLKRYVPNYDGKVGTNQYGNHWDQYTPDGRQVCVHAFIGKDASGNIATYQTLPFNMRGWHCGGTGNNKYIGFEICEDGLTDNAYFNKVYKEAVEFTAYLCKTYGLDPMGKNVIIDHATGHDLGIASNHGDVRYWFNKHGKTLSNIRQDVKNAMSGGSGSGGNSNQTTTNTAFLVRVKIDNLRIRTGAGTGYASAGYIEPNVYTIVEVRSADGYTWGKLKSGAGWIALEYTERL